MTTELQRDILGSFAELGFRVEVEGDETIRLTHEGVVLNQFPPVGETRLVLQAECARHLVLWHGWDGALWQRAK